MSWENISKEDMITEPPQLSAPYNFDDDFRSATIQKETTEAEKSRNARTKAVEAAMRRFAQSKTNSSMEEKTTMFKESSEHFTSKPKIPLPPKPVVKEPIKVAVIKSGYKDVEDGELMCHEIIKFIERWKNPVDVSFDD